MVHFSIIKWSIFHLTNTAELKARKLEASDLSKRLKDIHDELAFFYSSRKLFDIVITNDYTEKSCLLLQQLIEQKIRSD